MNKNKNDGKKEKKQIEQAAAVFEKKYVHNMS